MDEVSDGPDIAFCYSKLEWGGSYPFLLGPRTWDDLDVDVAARHDKEAENAHVSIHGGKMNPGEDDAQVL